MSFNFDRILSSKRALRRSLASKPVEEKLQLLDQLRDRAVTLHHAVPTPGRIGHVHEPGVEYNGTESTTSR